MLKPTTQSYSELQQAFDFFNGKLFDGALPQCLITLQRKNRSLGFFCHKRFGSSDGAQITDEIAMNPRHFWQRPLIDVLSTLVHEMVHAKQFHFGKPSRGGYHNREWALMMEQIGLMPSNTGEPGGKRTGQRMSHYIVAGGAFERAAQELLAAGLVISWGDLQQEPAHGQRPKFTCPECGLNAWARPSAQLACLGCGQQMVPA
jgi:SprT-like family protein